MAETATLGELLRDLTKTEIHQSYSGDLKKLISLVARLANRLEPLNVDTILPNVDAGQNIQLGNQHQWNLLTWIAFARQSTQRVHAAMKNLITIPRNEEDRDRRESAFRFAAREFIEGWAMLLPTLEGESRDHIMSSINAQAQEIDSIHMKAAETLKSIQDAAAKTGVAKHSVAFFELHEKHDRFARKWLFATFIFAAILLGAVGASIWYAANVSVVEYGRLFQILAGKAIGLSVLYYLLVFAARAYRSNCHLSAVNDYRARAIQSFEAFVQASHDEQAKSAVLLETTRCIYSHVPTGFLAGEDSPAPTQVVEILKAFDKTGRT